MAKKLKSQEFLCNICETHKMQQLGPIWGSETYWGPKITESGHPAYRMRVIRPTECRSDLIDNFG